MDQSGGSYEAVFDRHGASAGAKTFEQLGPPVWANDGCEGSGQYIPFEATKAERVAAGDPRPSVQERYPSFAMYRAAVMNAIDNLVKDRFMLCEDTEAVYARLLQAGLTAGVPAPNGNPMPQDQVPSCKSNGKGK